MAQTYNPTAQEVDEIRSSSMTTGDAIKTALLNRVSWGAVFAGVAMAFSSQLILNLIGIGIGVLAIDFQDAETTRSGVSLAAAAWWTISGVISSAIGGLTAGRLAGEPKMSTAGWHGLIVWAASILLLTILMTSAIGAVSGGPFQIVVNSESARIYGNGANDSPYASSGSGTMNSSRAVVDDNTISTAAIASAVALLLGALAAWYAGAAGAVAAPRERDLQTLTRDRV